MPVRPELRHLYCTAQYVEARAAVRKRAGGVFDPAGRYLGGARCEQCGVLDRKRALRAGGWWAPGGFEAVAWMAFGPGARSIAGRLEWHSPINGKVQKGAGFQRSACRWASIVLTCAHLNHTAGDDRQENLMLLCQWCHLANDSPHHKESRSIRKDQGRPLLTLTRG
jgi:hypothetical protein